MRFTNIDDAMAHLDAQLGQDGEQFATKLYNLTYALEEDKERTEAIIINIANRLYDFIAADGVLLSEPKE